MLFAKRRDLMPMFGLLLFFWITAVASAREPVLLDFYTDGCTPCAEMVPVMDRLAAEGYEIRRINVTGDRALTAKFKIKRFPTFVVVEDGREIDRIVGRTTIERLRLKLGRKEKIKVKIAPPAWRYEWTVGHRATVVRVQCRLGGGRCSKGSGVLVRWGKRVVVLTARHVVDGAREILVDFSNGRHCRNVRVLKADRKWDCAVLDVVAPEDLDPAEVACGGDAAFSGGERLESCGYGPDGKFAVNEGVFQGYRRASADGLDGPDDWMVISGHARQGDSGGPVFDGRGRVVGILWGTDGREVICVQPGRIHVLLQAVIAEQLAYLERRPTPPAEAPLEPVQWKKPAEQAGIRSGDKKPILPWRADEEAVNREQTEQIDKLIELERLRAANAAKPATDVSVNIQTPEKAAAEKTADKASPLVAGLCIFAAVALGFVIYFAMPQK